MMETERLFKVLDSDCSCYHGGKGRWLLPQKSNQPGDWMPIIEGDLVPCENGYHLCRTGDLPEWLGPVVFEADYRGERLDCGDKVVVRQARLLRQLNWTGQEARLFAADCAEHVLHLFENEYPGDNRPRLVIEAARQYAVGLGTERELEAARDAARAATMDAARDDAMDTTWDAARDDAMDTTWDAARNAARAAAWAAARAATMDAARDTARAAARAAAWAATMDATWDAAWDAERKWQTERLLQYLMNDLKEKG